MAEIGRPRTFDIEDVLDKALTVFWKKGYHAASLNDLTKEMGINKSSIYAAFGDKEGLFQQALELYFNRSNKFMREALSQPTAYDCFKKMLYTFIEQYLSPQNPRGCLIVQTLANYNNQTDPLRIALLEHCKRKEKMMIERFHLAQKEGDLYSNVDCEGLARLVGVIITGLAVKANTDTSMEELYRIVDTALMTSRCLFNKG